MIEPRHNFNNQDFAIDIEDFSGRNFDSDVLDTIVEESHLEPPTAQHSSDDFLDEEHWSTDSFDELKIEEEY